MSNHNVLLIHGTWGNGRDWDQFAPELERRGFTVQAPTLRHHGAPGDVDIWANAQKVAKVGLLDYVADLTELTATMDSPPIIVGHSMGTLLAQLLSARVPHKGQILLGPAPSAGMFAFYPTMILIWGRYLPQWLAGKPMYPCDWNTWVKHVCNELPLDLAQHYYATCCAESGTAYREMCLWYLDPKRAAKVNFNAIDTPALIITGSNDKATVPQWGRVTAKKYGHRATYVELDGSDHCMNIGPYLPKTLAAIDDWLARHHLSASEQPTDTAPLAAG